MTLKLLTTFMTPDGKSSVHHSKDILLFTILLGIPAQRFTTHSWGTLEDATVHVLSGYAPKVLENVLDDVIANLSVLPLENSSIHFATWSFRQLSGSHCHRNSRASSGLSLTHFFSSVRVCYWTRNCSLGNESFRHFFKSWDNISRSHRAKHFQEAIFCISFRFDRKKVRRGAKIVSEGKMRGKALLGSLIQVFIQSLLGSLAFFFFAPYFLSVLLVTVFKVKPYSLEPAITG